jgi:hypothetical protein
MKTRYFFFQVATFTINFISWYYALVFCAIYSNSSRNWIYGGIIGLVTDWYGISIAIPLSKAILRILVRNYRYLRPLIVIEYFYWVVGLFT